MVLFITNARAIVACDGLVDAIDVGSTNAQGRIRVYSGSVPADADAALGAAVLLAELNMSNPAFGSAVDANPGATATAAAISDDTSADATGTASFFRVVDRNVATILQGACATSGSQLNFNTTSIVVGATVSITSFTVTMPES